MELFELQNEINSLGINASLVLLPIEQLSQKGIEAIEVNVDYTKSPLAGIDALREILERLNSRPEHLNENKKLSDLIEDGLF